ncbi:hypothetical protein [Crassaminicella profunda]|uniref:hypothetical protein n=1 Tax=Crassaminicella profunda TaxID=1286698 RepID=UPI001CA74A49|nr:hypothetical protein [Crassaminicella profunda]QZY56489.1 hypothetical protein K7H06_06070 [Crassaminicella profunda]
MGNEITLTDEMEDYLKNLVNQNKPPTPNKIKSMINKEFDKNYAYNTILNKIREVCKKEWKKDQRVYESIETEEGYDGFKSEDTPAQFQLDFDNDPSKLIPSKKKPHKKTTKKKHVLDENIVNYFYNYMTNLNKNIKALDSKMNKIVNFINKFEEENSPEKLKQFSDDFIRIYAGARNKDSVNINAEIKQRVIKEMEKIYKIRKNQSLAINTALLVALYNSSDINNN